MLASISALVVNSTKRTLLRNNSSFRLFSSSAASKNSANLSVKTTITNEKLETIRDKDVTTAIDTTPIGNLKIISNQDTKLEPYRVDLISGVPEEMTKRSVRVYKPAKSATQSGLEKTSKWRLDFDITNKWENPLIGWTSS